jgi:signal transduction histidine kinase
MRSGLQRLFIVASVLLIGLFLYFSNRLVQSLGEEERNKMALWADAYHQLLTADEDADMTLVLEVINGNQTIPVFYTEADGTLLGYNNMTLPDDTTAYITLLRKKLTAEGRYFEIALPTTDEEEAPEKQYLYYDESILLHQLHYYPYIQVMVIVVFALLFYFMFMSRKRAEQNRVWVGLSKETAHQMGTPLSSLMAWMDFLRAGEVTPEVVEEMNKDVERLRTVAERFSKIGSMPKLEAQDLGSIVQSVTAYMQKRTSSRIDIVANVPEQAVVRPVCAPLFAWVIENLCRNAIDALTGIDDRRGRIEVRLSEEGPRAVIEVEDNGRGIAKPQQREIFRAGFTTKQRGWGLGLTLVKRIVEEYHHGRIWVKSSTLGVGTTFRIEVGTSAGKGRTIEK